jgi:hypothetical protein
MMIARAKKMMPRIRNRVPLRKIKSTARKISARIVNAQPDFKNFSISSLQLIEVYNLFQYMAMTQFRQLE